MSSADVKNIFFFRILFRMTWTFVRLDDTEIFAMHTSHMTIPVSHVVY